MPEAITPSSEKLVPIDTSGVAVDVTLKEDKTDDVVATTEGEAPVVEVQEEKEVTQVVEEKPQVEVTETKEEELEEYSAGVKKRIDKLTRKMREAERREQAAVDYAKQVKDENDKIRTSSVVQNDSMLVEREKSLVNQKEFAKRAMEAALNAQDVEKQVAAQQEIARLTIEDERLKISKVKALQRKAAIEKEPQENVNQPQEPQRADPKAVEWAEKNDWFGNDNAMTYTAYDIHNQLIKEGIDARDDDYYTEIDKRIRNEFPHKFNDGGDVSKPRQKVASVVRKSSTGRRTVRLTPSQVAIAKKLGVPLEEYAKHVKEA
jgi:hypothetical protein